MQVSVPGKLLLLGEYGVAFGGLGLAIAVNRRVLLRAAPDQAVDLDNLVDRCRAHAARSLGAPPPRVAWRADSGRLYEGAIKLGLGSSAAVAVGAVTSLLAELGQDVEGLMARRRLFGLILGAHRAVQGRGGSGVDLAASLYGGLIALRADRRPRVVREHTLPSDLQLVPVWTGQAASTPVLLGGVRRWAEQAPQPFERLLGDMRAVVEPFVATRERRAADWIAAAGRYGELMERLGEASGVGIVTPQIRALTGLARRLGGVAKPSGAGGGDVVLGMFGSGAAAARFAAEATASGALALDLRLDPAGARVEGRTRTETL